MKFKYLNTNNIERLNKIHNDKYIFLLNLLVLDALFIFMAQNQVVVVESRISNAYAGCQFI